MLADPQNSKLSEVGRSSGGIDILEGKRLFFESHERESHHSRKQQIPRKSKHNNEKAEIKSAEEKNSKVYGKKINSKKDSKLDPPLLARYRLRYDGYVKSANSVGVIVNGFPCHRIPNNSDKQLEAVDLLVECPNLKDAGLKLILLASTTSLKVTRGQQIMAIINPGQSL